MISVFDPIPTLSNVPLHTFLPLVGRVRIRSIGLRPKFRCAEEGEKEASPSRHPAYDIDGAVALPSLRKNHFTFQRQIMPLRFDGDNNAVASRDEELAMID